MIGERAVWKDPTNKNPTNKDPTKHAGGTDPSSQPIDLRQLARYTLREQALEQELLGREVLGRELLGREVLELFCRQSVAYLESLRAAMSEGDWRDATHALKGSARAVGAWRAARAAERAEALQGDVLTGEVLAQVRAMRVDEIEA